MTEQGHIQLTSQHIQAGQVEITPANPPTAATAKIAINSVFLGFQKTQEEPRRTLLAGPAFVVALQPNDQAGQDIFWTSYY